MIEIICIQNKNISVKFKEHILHVFTDAELKSLLSQKTEVLTDELVEAILLKYRSLFNTDFTVSRKSLAVEIWGHIYADKLMIALQSVAIFGFMKRLIERFKKRFEKIDIGEKGHDYNRFLWDFLAKFKPRIAKLLPK
ncbi:MAG: hypothetical protein JST21_15040 [Bacteroidetes bacterium]|nr:hypothetical protein [Bacteroidota bacterium]